MENMTTLNEVYDRQDNEPSKRSTSGNAEKKQTLSMSKKINKIANPLNNGNKSLKLPSACKIIKPAFSTEHSHNANINKHII